MFIAARRQARGERCYSHHVSGTMAEEEAGAAKEVMLFRQPLGMGGSGLQKDKP